MKIVVLTNNGSFYGKQILHDLKEEGIIVSAIVVIKQPPSYHIKLFNYIRRRVGLFDAILFALRKIRLDFGEKNEIGRNRPYLLRDYTNFSRTVIYTNGTNTERTVSALKELDVDLLILAQTGIVRKQVIDIPSIGVLNAHPGILPEYRGFDCFRWALANDDHEKIGASIHWVDTGIDTGNIIAVETYKLRPGLSMDDIGKELYELCVKMIVDTVRFIQDGGTCEGTPQQLADGKQYYKIPRKVEKIIEKKLTLNKSGRPR